MSKEPKSETEQWVDGILDGPANVVREEAAEVVNREQLRLTSLDEIDDNTVVGLMKGSGAGHKRLTVCAEDLDPRVRHRLETQPKLLAACEAMLPLAQESERARRKTRQQGLDGELPGARLDLLAKVHEVDQQIVRDAQAAIADAKKVTP